jgi:hypothetical protein
MSLIVLPLHSGDGSTDRCIQEILEELLTTARMGSGAGHDQARAPEPLIVVPEDAQLWRGAEHRPYVELGQVVLSPPSATDRSDDDRLRLGLRVALDRVLRHRTTSGVVHDKDAPELDVPGIVLVPVLHIADLGGAGRAEQQAEILEQLAGLARVVGWLEAAADDLVGGDTGRSGGLSRNLHLSVVPWIHLPRLPAAEHLPAALFAGPADLGAPLMHPVVYTQHSVSGTGRDWAGYGRARLLTDLFFLHGLSGSKVELGLLFPAELNPGAHRLYTMHSALFEYPLNELVCEARLGSLLSAAEGGSSVLPDPQSLAGLAHKLEDAVVDEVKRGAGEVSKLIRSERPADLFAFVGKKPHTHRPAPIFDGLGPDENRWQGWIDDGRWPIVGAERSADRLHSQVHQALEYCAHTELEPAMDQALKEAKSGIVELGEDLETQLGKTLVANHASADSEHPISRTQAALGKTLAHLAGLQRSVEAIVDDCPAPGDVNEILTALFDERGLWTDKEEALLEAGQGQPSLGGFWLELICVTLAILGVGLMSPALAVIPIVIGGGLVFLLARRRHRLLLAYFARWKKLSSELAGLANAHASKLVALVNQRTSQVKLIAVGDLQRSLGAVEKRFLTELHGLIGLVKAEQAMLARKHRIQRDGLDAAASGRFRFAPAVQAQALGDTSTNDFHDGLTGILKRTLHLNAMPERIPVREHELLIKGIMAWREEQQVEKSHADEASAEFRKAADYGANLNELSDVGVLASAMRAGTRYALVGSRLTRRISAAWVDHLQERGAEGWRVFFDGQEKPDVELTAPAQRAVLHAFAPEVAAVVTVRPWMVPTNGAREVSHEG